MKQASKPSFVSPKKKSGDGYSTHFGVCTPNSCSLPENPNEADHLASGEPESSPIWLCSMQRLLVSLPDMTQGIVTVALIR
jgi:hypothetical protein